VLELANKPFKARARCLPWAAGARDAARSALAARRSVCAGVSCLLRTSMRRRGKPPGGRAGGAPCPAPARDAAAGPRQVGVKSRHTGSGWGPPTLGISVEREVTLGGGRRSGSGGGGKGAAARAPAGQAAAPGAGGGAQRPGPRLGAAACDPTLDDKLAALDAAIAARFEAKGANPRRLADGVDVVSFQGGGKKT